MTATDQRLDEKRLEDIFSTYKPRLDLKEAIEKGLLAPIRAFRLESSIDLSEIRFNRRDYVGSDLERAVSVSSRNDLIARCVSEYFGKELPDKQGVVFCVNVKHAKEMAALLNENNIKAASVDGKDKDREKKIEEYMEGKIQFLCTCSLLTEGWDAPNTSVLVMARPTLSKVLYTQQLGRGTRPHPGKEFLYVIDVVDTYGAFGQVRNSPWTLHTLFESFQYLPWGVLVGQAPDKSRELIEIDTTHETVMALNPIDIFTWQKIYENYLSNEQLARELFVSTGTVNSWIGKGDIIPDQSIPMGRSTIHLFHPDSMLRIRETKGLKEHGEHTLVDDFRDFIEEGTYTFSYKIFFILAFLEVMNEDGEADINILMARYRAFYLERHENNMTVDRTNCPYNDKSYLMDDKLLLRSILQNPFEKFERKRFMSYSKDLKCISWHPKLREEFRSGEYIKELKEKMLADRDKYYQDL
ncbi:DEAD/DEAH box helicase [Spirochaeta isovalerica]|nr:helicase-related protein [Spirochaeta isovalerica]